MSGSAGLDKQELLEQDDVEPEDERNQDEDSTDGDGDDADDDENSGGGDVDEPEGEEEADEDGEEDEQEQQHELHPDQPDTTAAESRIGGWSLIKALLVRTLFIYFVSCLFRRGTQSSTSGPKATGNVTASSRPPLASNLFERGISMDLHVYISESESQVDFNSTFWSERNLTYGDWTGGPYSDGSFTKCTYISVSERVQNNGSLYIHVYFVKTGYSPNPSDTERYSALHMVHRSKQLNRYMQRRGNYTKKLLEFPSVIQNSTHEILSYWHPNLTINIVDDQSGWIEGSITAPVNDFVEIIPDLNRYYPIVYINDYWNMNSDYTLINSSTSQLELRLTYRPLTMFRWQIYSAQRMRSQLYTFLGESSDTDSDGRGQDSLKRMFLDTNPYLLGLTVVVSILHSIFEFLAFKNDVEFWQTRTSLAGLSIKSVFYGVFQSVVTLLYIIDNESSPIVRFTVAIAVAVELWKLRKAVNVKVDREHCWFGVIPRVSIVDNSSYVESHTKNYDEVAFRYVVWTLLPLFGAYAVYSVFYVEHRSWYSWLVGVLYGFLLTFSFISMTPQLFINYKLKSVAHLPWRTLTYKALNTFIDDLFAFVIRTPLLFRIGCFRDDIIFLIYLYQRWIYRIDPTRLDAFGHNDASDSARTQRPSLPAVEGTADSEGGDSLPDDVRPKTAQQQRQRHLAADTAN